MGASNKDPIAQLNLPPGFRFYPTDEELLVQYLCRKAAGHHFPLQLIAEINLYKFDPWVLPSKAMFGEKEWYFFSPRDRKYPNGSRPNRVAGSGYWKATGTDKVITSQGKKVGIKKALVFYTGKAPKGTKTNWIMHEYRLVDSSRKSAGSKLDDWVLCRIYNKRKASAANEEQSAGGSSTSTTTSHLEELMDSWPEINDSRFALPRMNSLQQEEQKLGLQSLLGSGSFEWSVLAGLTAGPDVGAACVSPAQGERAGGDGCVPCLPPLCHVDSPEEVQSGGRNQRGSAAGWGAYSQGPNGVMAQSYSGDPFGIRYTDQYPMAGFGFRE